jgi:hypothetical protein
MPLQQRAQLLQNEGRLSLAYASYQRDLTQSVNSLALAFDVPESTLPTRLHGTPARCAIRPPNRKLQLSEEQALV